MISITKAQMAGCTAIACQGGTAIAYAGADTEMFLEMLRAADRQNAVLMQRLFSVLEENARLRLALAIKEQTHKNG